MSFVVADELERFTGAKVDAAVAIGVDLGFHPQMEVAEVVAIAVEMVRAPRAREGSLDDPPVGGPTRGGCPAGQILAVEKGSEGPLVGLRSPLRGGASSFTLTTSRPPLAMLTSSLSSGTGWPSLVGLDLVAARLQANFLRPAPVMTRPPSPSMVTFTAGIVRLRRRACHRA